MRSATTTLLRSPSHSAPRPKLALLGTEPLRAAAEYLSSRVLPAPPGPPGDGHPVVIFPGLASDGHAVAPLQAHCQRLGYTAMDWGRGWNTGPSGNIDHWLDSLATDVESLLGDLEAPPTLIGWSLGGIYARELAKRGRLKVRQVITIGTPFNGSPAQTHAVWVYRLAQRQTRPAEPGTAPAPGHRTARANHLDLQPRRRCGGMAGVAATTCLLRGRRTCRWRAATWAWAGTAR